MAGGEGGDLFAPNEEKRIGSDDQGASRLLRGLSKRAIDVVLATGPDDPQYPPALLCRGLSLRRLTLGIGIIRVDQHGQWRCGQDFGQQLESLWRQLAHEQRHPRNVATRMPEAPNESKLDRVIADRDDDGYG